MTLSDKRAAAALIRLLGKMRETGRTKGRIEVTVDEGQAQQLRIVKISECEVLQHDCKVASGGLQIKKDGV
jgi:hypothetical protein